jgi:hypothetical protein
MLLGSALEESLVAPLCPQEPSGGEESRLLKARCSIVFWSLNLHQVVSVEPSPCPLRVHELHLGFHNGAELKEDTSLTIIEYEFNFLNSTILGGSYDMLG